MQSYTSCFLRSLSSGYDMSSLAPPVDRELLLDQVGGDESLVIELGQIFREEVPSMKETLRSSLSAEDVDTAVKRAAHRVRGSLLSMSALQGAAIADALESAGKNSAGAEYSGLIEALCDEIDRVDVFLAALG